MLVEPAGPRSRMLPLRSTWPGTISAIAASTLLGECPQRAAFEVPHLPGSLATGFNGAPFVRCATVSGGGAAVAVHANCSGWLMASPATPLSERSITWLLLRMTGLTRPGAVHRLPNVPMQQTFAPRSFAFAPEVPTFTGAVCASCSSLGKVWDIGVGVGAGVLEPPPPHPTATTSIIKPNKSPEILPIGIRL